MRKVTLWTAAVAFLSCTLLASAQGSAQSSAQSTPQDLAQSSAQNSAQSSAQPKPGKETKVKGLITARAADSITLRTNAGVQVVTLTDDTKVQSPKGLGIRKQEMSWTDLIPGLKVEVKGVAGEGDKIEAKTITFSKSDLQLASTIQAGLAPTQAQVATNAQNIETNAQGVASNKQGVAANNDAIAANKTQIETNQKQVSERFASLTDYEVKDQATVYFASGQSTLKPDDKEKLSQLASNATQLTGYMIQVEGFADSSGNLSANQTLSRDRADAVIAYLMQDGKVPIRHIVSPGAMGISNPAASNETSQGRADNRRAEIKVLVNKGLASGTQ